MIITEEVDSEGLALAFTGLARELASELTSFLDKFSNVLKQDVVSAHAQWNILEPILAAMLTFGVAIK